MLGIDEAISTAIQNECVTSIRDSSMTEFLLILFRCTRVLCFKNMVSERIVSFADFLRSRGNPFVYINLPVARVHKHLCIRRYMSAMWPANESILSGPASHSHTFIHPLKHSIHHPSIYPSITPFRLLHWSCFVIPSYCNTTPLITLYEWT